MKMYKYLLAVLTCIGSLTAEAKYVPLPGDRPQVTGGGQNNPFRAVCVKATAQKKLKINNVRALLLTGGDVWYDPTVDRASYVVPAVAPGVPEVSSLYASGIWLGAKERGTSNFIVAARTYRAQGDDYWPGPLDDFGDTELVTCQKWDIMFEALGEDINNLRADYLADDDGNGEPDRKVDKEIGAGVKYWPARGNDNFSDEYGFQLPEQDLAPFIDVDGDGRYNPSKGDHPVIEVRGCAGDNYANAVYADQMIWWVYNDNGNVHTQSRGEPMRMEVQCTAFGYRTTDELNNMTFYRYKLINKNPLTLDSTYFALWSDPDLGCPDDDFIGCSVEDNLGFVYNSDANDQTCSVGPDPVQGYGTSIPALGVDYFRGPLDQFGNELGMSNFTYYVRGDQASPPAKGEPRDAIEFYRLMSGFWKDGTPFTEGDDAYGGTVPTHFVFPGDPGDQAGWSMCQAGVPFADYRFLHTSGPFTLLPGGYNEIISGNVWVPEIGGGCTSMSRLRAADRKAQALFDNCFKLTDGPDAPDIDIVELNNELILLLNNGENGPIRTGISNNTNLKYKEIVPGVDETVVDSMYIFEGYKIYQVANANVSSTAELEDADLARLVAQYDVRNGVTKIFNWQVVEDPDLPVSNVFTPTLMVNGKDEGIQHSIHITEDQFATGSNRKLINHKKYYFVAVAYAYNNYKQFNPLGGSGSRGQDLPYLQGRRNTFPPVIGIPRPIGPEYAGYTINSKYADGGPVTRYDGTGSSGFYLSLSNEDEVEAQVVDLSKNKADILKYEQGKGPVEVKVIDPLRARSGKYRIKIYDNNISNTILEDSTLKWELYDVNNSNISYTSYQNLRYDYEQLIPELGISLKVIQRNKPGLDAISKTGLLGSEVEFSDNKQWLGGLSDDFQANLFYFTPTYSLTQYFNILKTNNGESLNLLDPKQEMSKNVLGFHPMYMADCVDRDSIPYLTTNFVNNAYCSAVQTPTSGNFPLVLQNLNNINIVFTPDKSQWSRCVVLESCNIFQKNKIGAAPESELEFLRLRKNTPSVGKDGQPGDNTISATGMSWFPGYAYDVASGKRVNIFFAENSFYGPALGDIFDPNDPDPVKAALNKKARIGFDMMFNPTSDAVLDYNGTPNTEPNGFEPMEIFLGGQHIVYATNQPYDSCRTMYDNLKNANTNLQMSVALRKGGPTWASFVFPTQGYDMINGIPPSKATVKLRVARPYEHSTGTNENTGYPLYEFELKGVDATVNNSTLAESALDLINVVPNPYYAYSDYERSELDNVIKITNLPNTCEINIYSIDGRFIKRYQRDEKLDLPRAGKQIVTSIDWDLKNTSNIPVASGVYLIHVKVPNVGERTLKAFIIARAFDPQRL